MDNVRISWPKPRSAIEGPFAKESNSLSVTGILLAALTGLSIWFASCVVFTLAK